MVLGGGGSIDRLHFKVERESVAPYAYAYSTPRGGPEKPEQ